MGNDSSLSRPIHVAPQARSFLVDAVVMAPSIYTPLPSKSSYLNIRLIRLQPSDDPTAPICCKIVCYPLVPERSVSVESTLIGRAH